MTVTLDHVTRTVEGIPHIRDVSLTLESGTLNVLLGPTLSGKTSIMRLLAGLDKPTTGKVLVNGKDVTGVDVRKRSVAMVYQQFINYPSLHGLREHRFALARAGQAARRDREARGGSRAAAPARAVPEAHAAPALRRPAAAHRDGARAGEGRRSRAARRTARQSRLQAARGAAHRAAAHLRGVRRDLRLCHDRADRSAAARRQHGLHVGGAGAPDRRDAERLPPSADAACRAGVLRSAAQPRRHREEERLCAICGRHRRAGVRSLFIARGRRLSRRLSRPSARARQWRDRPPRLPCHGDGDRDHRFGEFRASDPRRIELGGGAARRARVRARPDHRCRARSQ